MLVPSLRLSLIIALAMFAIALGACKKTRAAPERAGDGAPHITLRRLEPFPSSVLASAPTKPAFSGLACDGSNVHGVSRLGVGLTETVPGLATRKDPALVDVLPDKPSLAAVTIGPTSVVVVGARGVIVRRDNDADAGANAWKRETSPVANTTDLHGVTQTRLWIVAVGAGGTIVTQATASPLQPWTRIASPTREDLFAVSICTTDGAQQPMQKVCAVGSRGTLLVGDATQSGIVFRSMATGSERTLRAVAPSWLESGPAYAVGDHGTIVTIDANGARVVPSGTTEDLLGVAESEIARSKLEGSFKAVVAVGRHGTVVVQAIGRNKVSRFETLRVLTTDDLVAIVPDQRFDFIVAPRGGGLHTLGLNVDARHPFPPE